MKNTEISKPSDTEHGGYMVALRDLEKKMETMFHQLWRNPFGNSEATELFNFSTLNNIPKIDVVDRDKEIYVEAELPGIEKKDIDVSVANRQLVIRAKTCHEEKEEKGNYLRREISKKEFYRSVVLPTADIDESKTKSSFKNGVLKLTIPKKASSHRKRIEVQ